MGLTRRRFLTVFAAAALTGSSRGGAITRDSFIALGTEAQITLVGNQKQAEAALVACRKEVAAIKAAFSLYDSNSMLTRLNQNKHILTNKLFNTLAHHALAMAKSTHGAFDPTIQPLWQAYASGGDLHEARRLIDWRGLHLTHGTARFVHPDMAASFNGIAQGFAADRVSAILAQHGFKDTLVDLGEFAARGEKLGRPWLLGIRDPLTQSIVARIELPGSGYGGAIATSEPRGTLVAGHPHIFDPLERIGERWASVTVEANEAWRADALSTAIAASPVQEAESLLAAGEATRGWLITASGKLQEWRSKIPG